MLRLGFALLVAALSATSVRAASYSELFSTRKYADAKIQAMIESFDYQLGTIALAGGAATLELGPEYYFLDAKDARQILSDFVGLPQNPGTLGAIFPIGKTPVDGKSWIAEVIYDPMGRVTEDGLDAYDTATLLEWMQQDVLEYNPSRQKLGYPMTELVGWTQPPRYDAQAKKLYWAKEILIEGKSPNTLNYDIRVLGRRGVLAISFVSSVKQLNAVRAAAAELRDATNFAPGHAYADFDEDVDEEAEFDIAELIVGKSLDDLGALSAFSEFMKDFWILALIPVFGVWWFVVGRRTV